MKKFLVIGLLTLITYSCCGCAQYWYHPCRSFEDTKEDFIWCRSELEKYSVWPSIVGYERQFMEDCMVEKGYILVTEDSLPRRVKRLEADWPFRGQIHGLAGTVDY